MDYNSHFQIPAERQNLIMETVKRDKAVNVSLLAKQFFVNEATIRRDLNLLEKKGMIQRKYGGAVLVDALENEIPLFVRETSNKEAKDAIAEIAADFIKDGDTLMLDSSSTTMRIIPCLSAKKGLKIVTNGVKTTILLSKLTDCTVYCTGGVLRENSLSFIGNSAHGFIESFYADVFIFSCRGLDLETGLTDSNEGEAALRKLMIKNSRKSILLIDSTKFEKTNAHKIAEISRIDKIITEKSPGPQWLDFLKTKLIIAGG